MKRDRWACSDGPHQPGKDPRASDRHAAVLAGLRRPHYASVIEVGCAVGGLSDCLRQRCDRFLGLDPSRRALDVAGRRFAHLNDVAFRQVKFPDHWPRRRADLVLLREGLCALSRDELCRLAGCIDRSLLPGAEVVIVASAGPNGTGLSGAETVRVVTDALSRLRPLTVTRHTTGKGHVHATLDCVDI